MQCAIIRLVGQQKRVGAGGAGGILVPNGCEIGGGIGADGEGVQSPAPPTGSGCVNPLADASGRVLVEDVETLQHLRR